MSARREAYQATRRSLAEDARALRRRGLTMQQIADTLGISRATLYRYLEED